MERGMPRGFLRGSGDKRLSHFSVSFCGSTIVLLTKWRMTHRPSNCQNSHRGVKYFVGNYLTVPPPSYPPMKRFAYLFSLVALLVGAILFASTVRGADRLDFNRDVRPILSNHCWSCHGPDEAVRQGGLRLDSRDA